MARKQITRRDFLSDASKLAIGAAMAPQFPMIVPRHVLGGKGYTAPSAMLNIGVVGVGGQGSGNARSVASENLVAFCDVDPLFMEKNVMGTGGNNTNAPSPETIAFREKYQKAAKYVDFREMLAKQRDLDAVIIATPDHMHATVAVAAMRAGKHVYCQKPLTYSVYESRLLARVARETKVVTQMGNQGHSGDGTRRVVEWIRAGVIGPVREVHIYTDRPARFWAQGLPRPDAAQQPVLKAGNVGAVRNALAAALANANAPMPEGLRWDLYLGPVAEDIPYHPVYHPFTWRGWVDFGVGALGDMGAHLVDQAYWSLGLTQPTSIEATSSLWGTMTIPPPAGSPQGTRGTQKLVSYPMATTVHYQFPAVGSRPAVKVNWYDGGLFPPRPDVVPDDVVFDSEGGGIFIGDKGVLIHNTYGEKPRLFPASVAEAGAAVPVSVPRITESHHMNWVRACKGETQASSPFEYGAALNETMVLGIAALRAGQGRKVLYDAEKMQFTNAPDANQYLTREYRSGWAI